MEMKQLAGALNEMREDIGNKEAAETLTNAAAAWASFAVKHLSDPLLDPALEISACIARFTKEFQDLTETKE